MLGSFSNFADPFWFITIPMGIIGWCIALVASILNSVEDSSRFPVFSWWGLAFEGLVIVSIGYVVWSNRVKQYRLALLTFLAIATVYTSNTTNNFVWRNNVTSGATAAGNILSSIINMFWILYFGTTQDEPVHRFVDSFAGQKKPNRGRSVVNKTRHDSENQGMPASTILPSNFRSNHQDLPDISPQIPRGEPGMANAILSTSEYSNDPINTASAQNRFRSQEVSHLSASGSPLGRQYLPQSNQERVNDGSYPQQYGTSNAETLGIFSERLYADDERLSRFYGSDDTNVTEKQEEMTEYQKYPYRARAKYSYVAKANEGEISFNRGEILEVSDMTSKWWVCRNAGGDVGICPNNYLEAITMDEADAELERARDRQERHWQPTGAGLEPTSLTKVAHLSPGLEGVNTDQLAHHDEAPAHGPGVLESTKRPGGEHDELDDNLLSLI